MLTLALVVALPPDWEGLPVAAVLFFGLAATFAALYLVPVRPDGGPGRLADAAGGPRADAPPERMKWPLIPAAILAVMGLIFSLQSALLTAGELLVPAFLVIAGAALLVYAYRHRNGGHAASHRHVHRA